MEDVRNALTLNNVNQPKGSFDGKRQSYSIGANDQIFSASEYKNVIIAYKNGSPVRLKDIGDVVDNVERNIRLSAWVGKQPAVLLDIQRQPGANIIQTADRVKAAAAQAFDFRCRPIMNVAILYRPHGKPFCASVADVQFTLILTVVLVSDGHFCVPAKILGDGHSERGSSCRWPSSARSAS